MMAKMTATDFQVWVISARRSERLLYHDGLLMRDRFLNERVNELAKAAMEASRVGKVMLVQTRIEWPSPKGTPQEKQADPACGYYAIKL